MEYILICFNLIRHVQYLESNRYFQSPQVQKLNNNKDHHPTFGINFVKDTCRHRAKSRRRITLPYSAATCCNTKFSLYAVAEPPQINLRHIASICAYTYIRLQLYPQDTGVLYGCADLEVCRLRGISITKELSDTADGRRPSPIPSFALRYDSANDTPQNRATGFLKPAIRNYKERHGRKHT